MGTLNDLPIGETATVVAVGGEGSLRQHFLDMGIIPQADVAMVKHAPMGDPVEVRIHGYELTLRRDDARKIEVADEREADAERLGGARPRRSFAERVEHPGLGEGGKFHDRDAERPLPEGEPLTFALVGNQNCGKTTLFNQLTGANQHVGNFPGVTVDRKDGRVRGHAEATVTDLPGIYSLSPYSSEEVVTRQFLLDERPRGIINIVDATNVERNLYLTMQLLELGVPMVVALNMMDEVEGNGGTIRVNEMEKLLGVPVVPISASKNEGIGELVDHALHVARYQEPPVCQDFCAADAHGGAVRVGCTASWRSWATMPSVRASPCGSPPASWPRATRSCWRSLPSTRTRSTCWGTSCASWRTSAAWTARRPSPTCGSPSSSACATSAWYAPG